MYHELLAALCHTATASDHFWRCIYGEGLWIPRRKAEQLVEWGWSFTDPCPSLEIAVMSRLGFKLYVCEACYVILKD